KVTQHADFQRCILFIGHFCQCHSQPPLLTNAPQRSYCILYNSSVRRYRRSNTELLTGPAKLRPDRVPTNQFIICGAVSRTNAQSAVTRSGRYLISVRKTAQQREQSATLRRIGKSDRWYSGSTSLDSVAGSTLFRAARTSLIMLCSGICTFLTRRPAHRER